MNTTTQVTNAAGTQGLAGSLSILLMYALNAKWGWTFPPEVSIAFSASLGVVLHFICSKMGGCDTNGDGKADIGAKT